MRQLEAQRRHIIKSIETLSHRRDALVAELKLLVLMLGVTEPTKAGDRARVAVARKNSPELAMSIVRDAGEVTPMLLARRSGQTFAAAQQTLVVLLKAKKLRRVRRGVYAAVKK